MSMKYASQQLENARQEFESWHSNNISKRPLPEKMWAYAVTICRDTGYTPSHIAKVLQLNPVDLKRRLVESRTQDTSNKPKSEAQFISFDSPLKSVTGEQPQSASAPCYIELHKPDGSMMKIETEGYHAGHILELTSLFLRRKP